MYDIGEELWILKRPSVVEMKRQYEEMVARLNNGDPVPFRSTNIEKILYLRRKKLQEFSLILVTDQVPTQDTRPPKAFNRFSLSIPLNLSLPEEEEEEEEEDEFEEDTTTSTNSKKIESIEDWWGEFHTHNPSVRYTINIGSLSIGDQAIIELSSKLNDLIAKMSSPPMVHHLDLSWNDLYEEGMVAFSKVMGQLGGLTEIRLDGNQMGTAGLEACLASLTRAQPQEKKRSAGSFTRLNGSGGMLGSSPSWRRGSGSTPIPVSVSLRETNIGDESTPCLASFLKQPLPDNKILNLVQLDLTNTYIFDGITAITLALQKNSTLTTLILNSNMIGDQGAFAIGELLLTNQTLNRLEIRNCDIGPTGTSHLCEGLQAHKGLKNEVEGVKFTIDVGLNPWEFSGELQLLQTAIAKPNMNIKWREGDWEPTDDEEMTTLIRTFGETVVMERLMDGQGFLPLASPSQLIESSLIATYAPIHVTTIVDQLNPSYHNNNKNDTPQALPLLTTIVQLLQVHVKTSYRSWMSVLPSVLHHLCTWLDPGLITSSKFRRQIEVLTIDLLVVLGHTNQQIMEDIVVRSGIVNRCFENYMAFPNHNVFHLRLIKLVEDICSSTICGTLRGHTLNFVSGDFLNRLLGVIKEQSALNVRARSGSLTAAVMLAKSIEPHLEGRLSLSIKKLVKQQDDEQKGWLGGAPPERSSRKLVFNKDNSFI